MSVSKKALSVYIHWPFCKSKCPYCNFNSHVAESIDYKQWRQAYFKEIEFFDDYLQQHNIKSIFFGGGTPSLMPADLVASLINRLEDYGLSDNIEITLEANPNSVEVKNFVDIKNAGVNRVSIGVQSFDEDSLKFLKRAHSKQEAIEAISSARKIFGNYSFDLIYARPQQSLKAWRDELKEALEYTDYHMSLYQLTIEKGTEFYKQYLNADFSLPDEDLANEMYYTTCEVMEKNNLPLYEISNYAKHSYESQHNFAYWRYQDYLGLGPGAHSRITQDGQKYALMMFHKPDKWLKSLRQQNSAIQNKELLDKNDITQEIILMGMRLKEGINISYFNKLSGLDMLAHFKQQIQTLQDNGLVEVLDGYLKASKKGLYLNDFVVRELLDIIPFKRH